MRTPVEILKQLREAPKTCESPEDGVAKALEILRGWQNENLEIAEKLAVAGRGMCSWKSNYGKALMRDAIQEYEYAVNKLHRS